MTPSIRQESTATHLYLVNDPPAKYKTHGFEKVWHNWTHLAVSALTGNEFKLVHLLAAYQGENEWAWPSQKTLAAEMEMTKRSVRRVLTSLKIKGQIETKARAGKATLFHVTWDINVLSAQTYSLDSNVLGGVGHQCPTKKTQEEDEEKKHRKSVSLTEESSCERRAREEEKPGEEPDDSSTPTFGSSPRSPSPGKEKKETAEPPLSSLLPSGRSSKGLQKNGKATAGEDTPSPISPSPTPTNHGKEIAMSKAHMKTIMMIFDGKIDPRAPEDPAFMSLLDSIDDDEWNEDLRVLDPWRRQPVTEESE